MRRVPYMCVVDRISSKPTLSLRHTTPPLPRPLVDQPTNLWPAAGRLHRRSTLSQTLVQTAKEGLHPRVRVVVVVVVQRRHQGETSPRDQRRRVGGMTRYSSYMVRATVWYCLGLQGDAAVFRQCLAIWSMLYWDNVTRYLLWQYGLCHHVAVWHGLGWHSVRPLY